MTDTEQLERLANRLRLLSERGLNTYNNCVEETRKYFPERLFNMEDAIQLLLDDGYSWIYMPDYLAAIPIEHIKDTIDIMEKDLALPNMRDCVDFTEWGIVLLYKRLWLVSVEANRNPKVFDGSPIAETDIPY